MSVSRLHVCLGLQVLQETILGLLNWIIVCEHGLQERYCPMLFSLAAIFFPCLKESAKLSLVNPQTVPARSPDWVRAMRPLIPLSWLWSFGRQWHRSSDKFMLDVQFIAQFTSFPIMIVQLSTIFYESDESGTKLFDGGLVVTLRIAHLILVFSSITTNSIRRVLEPFSGQLQWIYCMYLVVYQFMAVGFVSVTVSLISASTCLISTILFIFWIVCIGLLFQFFPAKSDTIGSSFFLQWWMGTILCSATMTPCLTQAFILTLGFLSIVDKLLMGLFYSIKAGRTVAYPAFIPLEARLATFPETTSLGAPIDPKILAHAGHFHSVMSQISVITCYHCSKEVKDWQSKVSTWPEEDLNSELHHPDCPKLKVGPTKTPSPWKDSVINNPPSGTDMLNVLVRVAVLVTFWQSWHSFTLDTTGFTILNNVAFVRAVLPLAFIVNCFLDCFIYIMQEHSLRHAKISWGDLVLRSVGLVVHYQGKSQHGLRPSLHAHLSTGFFLVLAYLNLHIVAPKCDDFCPSVKFVLYVISLFLSIRLAGFCLGNKIYKWIEQFFQPMANGSRNQPDLNSSHSQA